MKTARIPMRLDDVDLLDLDRFVAQEHYDMFALLRREDPLHSVSYTHLTLPTILLV